MAENDQAQPNEMTVEEALQYTDDLLSGVTYYAGKRDLKVAAGLLAAEVRRLRRLKATAKYSLSDLLAQIKPDTPIPEDVKAWMEMLPMGKEKE